MKSALALDLLDGPLLVIAPHPDDETLGCGGVIAGAVRRGAVVHTIFITDGGASHLNSIQWSRQSLAAQREREAAEALARLGAGAQPRTFLRLEDANMPGRDSAAYRQAVDAVLAIVKHLAPRLVLMPWRRDPHRDHRDSWQLTMDAIAASGQRPEILEYAIWLDEFGRSDDRPGEGEMEQVAFDVTAVLDAKRDAIKAHRSQLGELVHDDPSGFVLAQPTIERLTGPAEVFWRQCGQ
ncbi:PIG-L deacetylase family protein [Oryzicola mucosus]|uniref:PIG-L family deacetylase n=1 Tax=Oryzicola mucosus TaxID=2767425 RepID=A0A8J6U088_9HYPH|nr:PIG-L deacetylase family protein [Oryzicola mucosus]MBD0415271.1 PIG-L family deacetylase [Oryzicola mucosus]